jgi:hypothetical protein
VGLVGGLTQAGILTGSVSDTVVSDTVVGGSIGLAAGKKVGERAPPLVVVEPELAPCPGRLEASTVTVAEMD